MMGLIGIWGFVLLGLVGWMVSSAFGSRRNANQVYVIKEWFASESPDQDGVYVRISGRKPGLISFFMNIFGIDPTVTLVVGRDNVGFRRGSWTGYVSWVTPLNKLCSGQYGYSKPFWSTVVLVIIGIALLLPSFGLSLILILGAIAYYFLNKTIVLGLTFSGGAGMYSGDSLAFKRSMIEGKNIDEFATERIVTIIEMIVRGADKPRAVNMDAGARPTASETLSRAASELTAAAERTREKTESLAAQARQMGERAAAKVSTSMAAASTPAPPAPPAHTATQPSPPARIASVCPQCRKAVTGHDTFCGECGFKLS